jgi:hypothetical protein
MQKDFLSIYDYIVNKTLCANCAVIRNIDLLGLCWECNKLHREGNIVKVKDTLDKDRWSCGCECRPEGFYPCNQHTVYDNPSGWNLYIT